MMKSKYSREDKRRECSNILNMINDCKTENELEVVSDYLEESLLIGLIFKKDYKYLSDELDDRLMTLVEEGLI